MLEKKVNMDNWQLQNTRIEQNILDVQVTEDMVKHNKSQVLEILLSRKGSISPRRIYKKYEQIRAEEKSATEGHCSNLSMTVQKRINQSKLNF